MGIKILGTGSYVPEQTVTNDDFSKFIETNDEWIKTRTGISERRISGWEPTWYMGLKAAEQAIEAAGIKPEEIGLIIDSTVTSDFFTPSTACIIQDKLGAKNAGAFDVNAACTGFVCALDTARCYLEANESLKYVLVVSNENLSRIVDYDDRSTCILFGDGAAAAVVTRSSGLYSSHFASDGSGAKYLYAGNANTVERFKLDSDFTDEFPDKDTKKLYQDGKAVYKFATHAMPEAFRKAAEKIGITADEIDWFVPHQANIRIIESAAKKLKVSMDKFIITLDHYGNTSSASIPLALDEAIRKGMIKSGQTLALIGFGAGLTYGGIILEY